MWHCLYAYRIVGDNVYGLGKLVPYGSISFSGTFFGCLRPNGKGVTIWGSNHHFQSFHATISTDINTERTFVNLLVS